MAICSTLISKFLLMELLLSIVCPRWSSSMGCCKNDSDSASPLLHRSKSEILLFKRFVDGINSGNPPVCCFFLQVLLCNAMYPTIRPNLLSTQAGKSRRMTCSAKACEATFSLVSTIILRVGSTVISPAIMAAAALVLPAPKTPLNGQSVLPSKSDKMSAARVARKWPSLFCTSGKRDAFNARSSSVSSGSLFVTSTSCITRIAAL